MLLTKDYSIYVRIPKLRVPRLNSILEKCKYRITLQGSIPKRITVDTPKELWAKLYIVSENQHILLQYYPNEINPQNLDDKSILINIHELDQLPSYLSIMGLSIDLNQYVKKAPQVTYVDLPF